MIKIEIITEGATEVTAAFYYPVPPGQYLPGSNDQSRTPVGSALSAQEIQDLKDGNIIEHLWSSGSDGLTTAQRQSKLVSEWAQERGDALSAYRQNYKSIGSYYDGTWN